MKSSRCGNESQERSGMGKRVSGEKNSLTLKLFDVSGGRERDEPDGAAAVRASHERALRRLLQLRHQDPPDRAVPLRQPLFPQRVHLPRDPEVSQDPAGHEVHPVAEGGDQVRQRCGEYSTITSTDR